MAYNISNAGYSENDFNKLALKFGGLPDQLLKEAREKLLPEIGKIIEEYQVGEIQTRGMVRSGDLRDGVKSKVVENRVNVAPVGSRKDKRSNQMVAFFQQFTDGKGKGFVDAANKAAEDEVFELAERELGLFLDGVF